MAKVCWPYFDPEYENLSVRINPPRVSVDNTSCRDCTVVKVDSVNKPGILLGVVQILTDLDFIITKAYVSSDGGWFGFTNNYQSFFLFLGYGALRLYYAHYKFSRKILIQR
ncbi:hypothetical protein REPUB_Repub02eG0112000 [Reevesia pubescens]